MEEERDYSGIISLVIYLLLIYGYFANIYKLTKCDFDTPMKAEAYRITGVVLFPVGIVQGYMDIEDGKK